jgi:translation initiation factor 1
MATRNSFNDFSDLRNILPESIRQEMERQELNAQKPQKASKPQHDGKGKRVYLNIERKGRSGKTVTIVGGFQHNPQTMEEIAKILKAFCGAGGTVRGMTIEIQGDQRKKLPEKLQELNYTLSK